MLDKARVGYIQQVRTFKPRDGPEILLIGLNPIQYGLFLKHYGMGGGHYGPPCNFAVS